MSDSAIYTKTKSYIQALLETEEAKAYKKSFEEYKHDDEAKKLLSDFQEAQQTCAIFRQGGFDRLKEAEKKLRDMDDKLSKNKKIQSLIKTQQGLQSLVGDLVGDISKGINFPFVKPRQGCGCG